MKRYRWLIGVFVSVLIIVLGFVIPVEVDPPENDTVIIDYTLGEYSAPACFDQAEFTNNIDETTFEKVEDHSRFSPESDCTTEEFTVTTVPLWFSLFR
ncbi:hypothetical protein [Alkalicoccobacillus porphyridii]|uniref:Uncharacterized protein n=1 Tax=Alkalicoccobacillus porphyridii TaxID=2597270 RepID=A0A554A2K3_9BACI|nr:hypothetical protein [Alkalicoccobacillus porphyridii]TSB47929.1 hypothetical protein FN960_05335 [Alkalicoccobacillus porphyridii]